MATELEYEDIVRYKTSTDSKYRPGLSDNDKRNIREKAARYVREEIVTVPPATFSTTAKEAENAINRDALSVWKARLDAGHDRVRFLQPVVPPELR